jgi:capsular exopolysaccharide synthesis family protein
MALLRNKAMWLVIAMIAGLAGGWLAHAGQQQAYTSTGQVDIEAHVIANTTPVAPNMATEKQVATSGVVLTSIAHTLGDTPSDLTKDLKAEASGTSNILSISCTTATPATAQRCAAAAVAGYVAFCNETATSAAVQAHNPLHATVVTAAVLPLAPAGLSKKILLPLGAVLGLILGIGAIFLRDHLDDRVRDRADLERYLEAPVVAAIPRVPRRAGRPTAIFRRAPLAPASEAYRHLRVRLEPLIGTASDGAAVLLVTSWGIREGRTSVAANLAAALAHAGVTVILVDADLRRPSQSTVFETGERPGLADLLAGRASVEEVAVPTEVPGLKLVTVGKLTLRSADMFEVKWLNRAFAKLKARAEVIVVDSAPISALSDAIPLAQVSDIAVLVAKLGRTRRADVSAAAGELKAAEPRVIVGVLNNAPRSHRRGQVRPSVPDAPETLAPTASVPSVLAASVPPRGPNGSGRTSLDARHLGSQGPSAGGSDADDEPTSFVDPE